MILLCSYCHALWFYIPESCNGRDSSPRQRTPLPVQCESDRQDPVPLPWLPGPQGLHTAPQLHQETAASHYQNTGMVSSCSDVTVIKDKPYKRLKQYTMYKKLFRIWKCFHCLQICSYKSSCEYYHVSNCIHLTLWSIPLTNVKLHSDPWPTVTSQPIRLSTNFMILIPSLTFTDYEWFPWSICNGCGMPGGNAYPSGHLVPSPIVGLACAPIVETRFLELAMSLLDFSPRIPLGTFSIFIWWYCQ